MAGEQSRVFRGTLDVRKRRSVSQRRFGWWWRGVCVGGEGVRLELEELSGGTERLERAGGRAGGAL